MLYSFDDINTLAVGPSFDQNIDYMDPKTIDDFHLYQCWRQNNSQSIRCYQDDISVIIPSTISRRLENVCWRRWYKSIKSLGEIAPSEINWYKDQDITWLYGPKFTNDSKFELVPEPQLTEKNLQDNDLQRCESQDDVSSHTSSLSLTNLSWSLSLSDLEDSDLKSSLKTASTGKRKTVKFCDIVNSREIINGRPFDYDFLDIRA